MDVETTRFEMAGVSTALYIRGPATRQGSGQTSVLSEDQILSQFVAATKAEPGLARDLLAAASWNVNVAMRLYQNMLRSSTVLSSPSPATSSPSTAQRYHPQAPTAYQPAVVELRANPVNKWRKHRGMSLANRSLVGDFQRLLLADPPSSSSSARSRKVSTDREDQRSLLAYYTMSLPGLHCLPERFRRFVCADLLEGGSLRSLERSGECASIASVRVWTTWVLFVECSFLVIFEVFFVFLRVKGAL